MSFSGPTGSPIALSFIAVNENTTSNTKPIVLNSSPWRARRTRSGFFILVMVRLFFARHEHSLGMTVRVHVASQLIPRSQRSRVNRHVRTTAHALTVWLCCRWVLFICLRAHVMHMWQWVALTMTSNEHRYTCSSFRDGTRKQLRMSFRAQRQNTGSTVRRQGNYPVELYLEKGFVQRDNEKLICARTSCLLLLQWHSHHHGHRHRPATLTVMSERNNSWLATLICAVCSSLEIHGAVQSIHRTYRDSF